MQRRYEGLDAKIDPLAAILAAVPFERFRVKLKTALVKGGLVKGGLVKGGLRRAEDDRTSAAASGARPDLPFGSR